MYVETLFVLVARVLLFSGLLEGTIWPSHQIQIQNKTHVGVHHDSVHTSLQPHYNYYSHTSIHDNNPHYTYCKQSSGQDKVEHHYSFLHIFELEECQKVKYELRRAYSIVYKEPCHRFRYKVVHIQA